MSGLTYTGSTFNLVRQVTVTNETLQKIAELLGIPATERVVSGTIHIAGAAPRGRAAAPRAARGGAARTTAARGTARRRK